MIERPLSVLVGVCLFTSAFATDGNDLIRMCGSPPGYYGDGFCLGYITGIVEGKMTFTPRFREDDTLTSYETRARQLDPSICVPDRVTKKQVVDIVVKYLNDKPALRQYDAALLIQTSVSDAFPCKGGKP